MMMATTPLPRQARSERTLARLEQAATRLLEDRTWADLTLAELVSEARSSIGSFYNLFRDKDALLDYLDERYARQMIEHLEDFLVREYRDLREAAREIFGGLVDFHRRRRGLIRALVLRARSLREPAYDERTDRMNRLQPRIVEKLCRHCREQPRERMLLAFSFAFSALRDRVLFPESIQIPLALDDNALADALTDQFCRFLST